MSNIIPVPYIPIKEFKIPDKLFEETDELIDENPVLEPDNGQGLSQYMLLILRGIGMEKYIKNFAKHRVRLDTFLKLNETDLKKLGITDPDDVAKIVKELGTEKQSDEGEFIVKENHIEDLQIVRNIQRQVLLLQNYCAYVELQMKKNKLTDYIVPDSKKFASLYLKAFAEAALIQSQIMSKKIYDEYSDDGLIDKILTKYNLILAPAYYKTLPQKKRKEKESSVVKKVINFLGIASIIVIIGKFIFPSKSF